MSADHDERRREPRNPLTLKVEYAGATDLVADYTENISRGGLFVLTQRDFEPGARVRLVLSFAGLLQPLSLSGTVRWVRHEPAPERGVGIEFDSASEEDRARLDELVARIAASHPDVVARTLRVLVVEDNPHVANLIRDGLSSSGKRLGARVNFQFTLVENGRAALEVVHEQPFDVLIVDIYLPIMDGATLIRELKNDPKYRNIPVLAISAGGISAKTDALKAGADLYLDKPMRLTEVMATIQTLMAVGGAPRS